MRRKLLAYLDLVRIPNVFTAVADIIAGFLYVGCGPGDWLTLLLLGGASSCLYGGGAALNDVRDVERDTRERPSRPIPSGRVSRHAALGLAVVLLAAGLAFSAAVSGKAAVVAALLVASIVLYDTVFKSTVLAPSLMGLCRGLNLSLAMSSAPDLWDGRTIVPVALMWLYATSVTFFARDEAAGAGARMDSRTSMVSGTSMRGRLLAGTAGICLAVGGLAGLCWVIHDVRVEYLGLVALMGLTLGYRGFAAAANPQPLQVQRAVKTFVVSFIAFDTCIAWASQGPLAALAVAVIILPTILLGRLFRVT